MNVFYPYTQTKDNGTELKYSIRSMVKHFKGMDGLILVGDRPTWFRGYHIQCANIEKRKEYSVFRKLMLAKYFTEGPVLLCHDDVFALQDFDSSLPNYFRGTCKNALLHLVERRFKDMFSDCPPDWLNFEIHCPMVIDPFKIEDEDRDFLLKTTYANRLRLPGIDIADCKLRGDMNRKEIRKAIKDRPFFSTADNAKGDVLKCLKELYPENSKYEVYL